ncbi:MAG: hypothetical protein AAGA87_12725 [Pseudomonadota bacterium]
MFYFRHLLGAALAIATAVGAHAADLSRFDRRTIEVIVGSKPGGGYDRTARLIATHLETVLEGSTTVVNNQDRAGGVVALNRLAAETREAPTVMMYNTGFLMGQIAGDPMLTADLGAMEYIGKVTSEARYLVVSTTLGITDFEGLKAHNSTLLVPVNAINSSGFIQSKLVGKAFGLDLSPLTGFSGSEARAALAKGELHVDLVSENNVARLIKADAAVPVLRFGPAGIEDYAGITDAEAVAETDEQKLVARQIANLTQLGRIIVASPGMPADDLAALQAGFTAALETPELLTDAEEQGVALDAADGAATKALIADVLVADPTFVDLVKAVLE